ncbi:MAG: hypothetical protein HYX91_00235 [Chloroflexi bacterium]|nr:hypothetical protein [Chloroflexota bacterium]
MLTIFSTPKPFRGQFETIQTNAIQSWLSLRPACEVIIFGEEAGTAEFAARAGIRHITGVQRNEYGTPLVSSMFQIAQGAASHRLMCYVNCDIILMSDFLRAVQRLDRLERFLVVGRRHDLDLAGPLDFSDPAWESRLQHQVKTEGRLHGVSGIDYFAFPRGQFKDMPPFAIGRPGWDNWLIYHSRSLGMPVIDATRVVTAVHQNHDYSHHPEGEAGVWNGPERWRNRELMGGKDHAFSLDNVTHIITPGGLKPALTPRHLYFRARGEAVTRQRLRFSLKLFKALEGTLGAFKKMSGLAR